MVVGDESREWTEVTDYLEIEQRCLAENRLKFFQSTQGGNPFTIDPLLGNFGYLVVGKKVREFLGGNYGSIPPPKLCYH